MVPQLGHLRGLITRTVPSASGSPTGGECLVGSEDLAWAPRGVSGEGEADVKRSVIVTGIAVALLIAVLVAPAKVTCPNGPCTTAPDAQGNVHRYYEMKPLGAALIEEVTGLRVPIHYSSGVDTESLR